MSPVARSSLSSLDEKRASASTAAAAAASSAAPSATRRCVAGSAALEPSSWRRMARPRWNSAGSGRSCEKEPDGMLGVPCASFGLLYRMLPVLQGVLSDVASVASGNEAPAARTRKSSPLMAPSCCCNDVYYSWVSRMCDQAN